MPSPFHRQPPTPRSLPCPPCTSEKHAAVSPQDLDFEAAFEMIVTSPGTVSGLVVSFDTGFFARSDPPPTPQEQQSGKHPTGTSATTTTATTATTTASGNGGDGDGGKETAAAEAKDGASGSGTGEGEARRQERPIASWFSTGPESRPTHWKQTLLWLRPSEKPETLESGDAVAGRLALSRNEVNPRELGLVLTWTAVRQSTGQTFGGTQKYVVC